MLILTVRRPPRVACRLLFILLFLSLSLPALAAASQSAQDATAQDSDDPCPTYAPLQTAHSVQDLTLYGVACFESERYDWALTYYLRAFALHPGPLLLGAIGRSLHELGLYGPAQAQYEAFLSSTPEPAGAERIRSRIAQLHQTSAEDGGAIALQSSPSGARVHLILDNGDWFPLGVTPVQVDLKKGRYQFVFEDDGFQQRQQSARVKAGQEVTLHSELVPAGALFNRSSRQWRRAGALAMGASLPITAAGLTLVALSSQQYSAARELEDNFNDLPDFDERRTQAIERAGTYRTWGIITTAVGTTGLITGAILFSLPPQFPTSEDSEQAARKWRIEPLAGFNQVGIRLHF